MKPLVTVENKIYLPGKDQISSVQHHKNPRTVSPIALGRAKAHHHNTYTKLNLVIHHG